MLDPGFPTSSQLSPSPPRKRTRLWRRRRPRTVFSAQQLRVLEEFFEGKPYGTYEERETLAARLNLQEDQVRVWLKNRRAKDQRLQRLCRQQGQGAQAAPQELAVCAPQPRPVPSPAPAGPASQEGPLLPSSPVLPAIPVRPEEPVFPAGPVFPASAVLTAGPVLLAGFVLLAGPVLPTRPALPAAPVHRGGPGFGSLPPHRPLQVFQAAHPSSSSYSQACCDPVQGVQGKVTAVNVPAPAPAPAPDPDQAPTRDPDPAPSSAQAPAPAPAPDRDPAPTRDPDPAPVPAPSPAPAPAPAPALDLARTPTPAPSEATLSPQGPDNAGNCSSDPDFTDLLSAYSFLEEPFSSPRPWYDFVGDSDVDLFQLLDLPGSVSPPSPADAAGPEGAMV